MSIPFQTLGLNGGGVKGLLHIGALLELSKHQSLEFPNGVYGVSVGSIIGTYIAFGLPFTESEISQLKEYFKISNFIENFDLKTITSALSSKGLYDMTLFEKFIIELFESKGVDIRNKVIGDAVMPLYIISSNLTKGVPTLFSKNVKVLDALKCSCCIPGVFKPQVLYDQVYVDGNVFCPSVDKFIPNLENALCLSLKYKRTSNFTPETIETMSPLTYIHDIYSMVNMNFYNQVKSDKSVLLSYPNLQSTSDIQEFDVDDILKKSGEQLHDFLSTKSILQELTE